MTNIQSQASLRSVLWWHARFLCPRAFLTFLMFAGVLFALFSPIILLVWLSEKYGWDKESSVLEQRFDDWVQRKCTKVEIES